MGSGNVLMPSIIIKRGRVTARLYFQWTRWFLREWKRNNVLVFEKSGKETMFFR